MQAEESEVVLPAENARQGVPAVPAVPVAPGAAAGTPTINAHWTEQLRVAVNAANERTTQNMIIVLGALSETMRDAGLNNTRAFGKE